MILPSVSLSRAFHRLAIVLTFWTAVATFAETRTFEFGDGLDYVRVRNLDTETPVAARAAMIVDLRGSTGTSPLAATRLAVLLDVRSPGAIRLVLIDGATASNLVGLLKSSPNRLLTLGAAGSGLALDITVATTVETDLHAREAIDAGTPLPDLLDPKREKRRYDEAAMVRDHANGLPIPGSPPETDTPKADGDADTGGKAGTGPAAPKETKAKPLVDQVLQRAIHVHQALRALKKL